MEFNKKEFIRGKEIAKENLKKAALRVSQLPSDIMDSMENWIRSLFNSVERKEFNYDGLKKDVQTIILNPKQAKEILSNRLSMYDKDSLVAILSKNPGISPEDAERIITKIETTRDSMIDKVKSMEGEARKKLEQTKARIWAQLKEQD